MWDRLKEIPINSTISPKNLILKMAEIEVAEYFNNKRIIHTFNYEGAWFELKQKLSTEYRTTIGKYELGSEMKQIEERHFLNEEAG